MALFQHKNNVNEIQLAFTHSGYYNTFNSLRRTHDKPEIFQEDFEYLNRLNDFKEFGKYMKENVLAFVSIKILLKFYVEYVKLENLDQPYDADEEILLLTMKNFFDQIDFLLDDNPSSDLKNGAPLFKLFRMILNNGNLTHSDFETLLWNEIKDGIDDILREFEQ